MTFPELLYYLGYSIKKSYSIAHQKRLPCKVISIGNITLGGTGKTPATIAVAKEAKKRGFMPCVLTRGYKGKAQDPCFLSKGEGPLLNEYQAGDEAMLLAEKLKGVPVIKGSKRYEAGVFAMQNLEFQTSNPETRILFILDDGFQHWGLFRDRDILLIDSLNPFGNRRLLPLGKLREPVSSMKRADVIVVTKTDNIRSQESEVGSQKSLTKNLIEEIREHNAIAPICFAEHRPSTFITASGETFPLEWAKDKKFFGFCGIGNPGSFRKTLTNADVNLTALKTFRDHHRYSKGDLREIIYKAGQSGADWIVTTEKDIMRIRGMDAPENLVALAIEFLVEEKFYNAVFFNFKPGTY